MGAEPTDEDEYQRRRQQQRDQAVQRTNQRRGAMIEALREAQAITERQAMAEAAEEHRKIAQKARRLEKARGALEQAIDELVAGANEHTSIIAAQTTLPTVSGQITVPTRAMMVGDMRRLAEAIIMTPAQRAAMPSLASLRVSGAVPLLTVGMELQAIRSRAQAQRTTTTYSGERGPSLIALDVRQAQLENLVDDYMMVMGWSRVQAEEDERIALRDAMITGHWEELDETRAEEMDRRMRQRTHGMVGMEGVDRRYNRVAAWHTPGQDPTLFDAEEVSPIYHHPHV